MTAEPLDRRRFLTDARDRLVNPLTGLRLRLEELMAGSADDAATAQELRAALGIIDRLDGELDGVLQDLLTRLPQDPATSLVDVIGEVIRRHGRAAQRQGRRLWVGSVDDVAVAADREPLLMLLERMVVDALLDHRAPVELRAVAHGATITIQVAVAAPFTRVGADGGARCSREIIGVLAERCGGRWVPAEAGSAGVRVVLPLAG